MPRPTKAFKRQRANAAAAWKKGERKEAYELWAKAAAGLKEHQSKKKKNKQAGEQTPAAEPTS